MLKHLAGACLLSITSLGAAAMGASLLPFSCQTVTLPNGLTVILIPMESHGLVAYYSIVRTGSRDEVEPGRSGFAHFFEHIMFRGTKRYPGSVYDSLITGIGADANAYTTDDYTAFHLNIAREDLGTVIALESDRFRNLYYDEPAFQTEAGAVYGEYRKGITQPFALLNETMQNLAYDVHTYKHTTIGFEADIKAMPKGYAYSKEFFRRFYRPENVVLLVVGDFDPPSTMTLIADAYGPWDRGYVAPRIQPEPAQRGERTALAAYPGSTLPIIDIAYKGDAFDPENRTYVAAQLLGDLAFGETSELRKRLVIRDQTVEFISPSIPVNRDAPLFEIVAMVRKEEHVPLVRDAVYATLERFQSTRVEEGKLAALKRRNRYRFLMGLDTPDHVAGRLARFIAVTGGWECVERLFATMDAITPDDLLHAARHYFQPERRSVVVMKGTGK